MMPGKAAALVRQNHLEVFFYQQHVSLIHLATRFDVTLIRTLHSDPSDNLNNLESKILVIHSSNVYLHGTEYATKLIGFNLTGFHITTIVKGMALIDKPIALAKTYRQALEEQTLN